MQALDNKTALITGGSKGIGFGIAASLIEQNMNVAVTSRNLSVAKDAAEKLNRMGKGQALGIQAGDRSVLGHAEVPFAGVVIADGNVLTPAEGVCRQP